MKKTTCFLFAALFLLPGVCAAQEAPHDIAGFTIGGDISSFQHQVNPKTDLPIRYAEYIHEVEILPTHGFKSGLISYATCQTPGRIIRIKLKFANGSPAFYEDLLKRYKKRFGEPDDWKGDPFHVVISWKWSFTDAQGNRISMILQHNVKDTDEKIGNTLKLTMHEAIENERLCFIEKNPDYRLESDTTSSKGSDNVDVDWEIYIPK